MDIKIGFFGVKSWEKEAIVDQITRLPVYGVGIFEEEVQDKLDIAKDYDVISTFIYSDLSKKMLDKLPKLKMVAARSTGVDHIDSAECQKRKIEVKNVPEYGSQTVAEYTVALMMALTKKIIPAHQSVENGEFSPEGLTGIDLFGKTLGVVGVGKIGANVVKLGRGLGMKVIGVEKNADEVMAKKHGYKIVDLETCLKQADIVTLHVPSIPQTYHLINKKNIGLMKKGSYLINTCRGPVVESSAVVWALNKGVLAGAALDVVEEESRVENISVVLTDDTKKSDLQDILSFHLLRDRDDVIITPHNAFNTREAIGRIVATTVDNILEFIKI
ncbi:MAG: NAD(P)-dependent oxidoreductase [Candidatus Shapirobacteria bacterium]